MEKSKKIRKLKNLVSALFQKISTERRENDALNKKYQIERKSVRFLWNKQRSNEQDTTCERTRLNPFNKRYWIGQKVFISFEIKKHPESFWVRGFLEKYLATAAKKKYDETRKWFAVAGGFAGIATYSRRKQQKKKKRKRTKGDS